MEDRKVPPETLAATPPPPWTKEMLYELLRMKINEALESYEAERLWRPHIIEDLEFIDLYSFFRWMECYKTLLLDDLQQHGWPGKTWEEAWNDEPADVMRACLDAMERILYAED